MAEPVFTRATGQDPLFRLPDGGWPPGYGIAFLPLAPVSGNSLTLTATWTTTPGIYLFLGAPVADDAALASAVLQYAGSQPIRFFWIAN
ncbi:MAG: hypothetical protein ACLGH0_13350, partial [Thermoanaerobaculia bacterium]